MKPTILTIDDEDVILRMLYEFLEIQGYTVLAAHSPREAKEVMADHTIDLIITDLQLENSDGLELVEEIRQLNPDIPVVLLTGVWFDEHTIDAKLSHKISAYHNKTAPLNELGVSVARLLAKSSE